MINNNFKVMVGGIGEGNILLHVAYEEEIPLYNRGGYESVNVNTKLDALYVQINWMMVDYKTQILIIMVYLVKQTCT